MTNGSIITNNGRKIAINRIYKGVPDYTPPSRLRLGINNGTPLVTDTALDDYVPLTGTESVDTCDATTGWSAGTDSAVTLNTSTYKEGTGSLSIAKSGTAGTSCSISKTTTSRDFTNKDFHIWIYILDITDLISANTALTIRFGSDNSNYYSLDKNISTLSNGWNHITFNFATKTATTGTPVITACDYTQIIFYTDLAADTIAANRILVDDIKLASSDDYIKTLDSGYPIIDETNMQTTMQFRIYGYEANGYNINGSEIINTDSSTLNSSEDTFVAESKSVNDEFILIYKDRVI